MISTTQNAFTGRGSGSISSRRLVEWLLGVVLLLAASLKAYGISFGLGQEIAFPGGKVPITALIESEAMLGSWLLVGGFPVARFYCAFICFCLFATVGIAESVRGAPSCGCFGDVRVPPAFTATFDLIACCGLWVTGPRAGRSPPAVETPASLFAANARCAIFVASVTLISLATWRTSGAAGGPGGAINPAEWISQPSKFFNLIEGDDAIRHGRWLIVFYRFSCDECRRAIPTYAALARLMQGHSDDPRVAFVPIPPYALPGRDPILASDDFLHLSLRSDREMSVATPVVAAIQDGKVIAFADGADAEIPP